MPTRNLQNDIQQKLDEVNIITQANGEKRKNYKRINRKVNDIKRTKNQLKDSNLTAHKRNILQKKLNRQKYALISLKKERRNINNKIKSRYNRVDFLRNLEEGTRVFTINFNDVPNMLGRDDVSSSYNNIELSTNYMNTGNANIVKQILMNENITGDILIIVYENNIELMRQELNITDGMTNRMWNNGLYLPYLVNSDETIFHNTTGEIKIVITKITNVKPRLLRQYFLDGGIIHCALTPILEYFSSLAKRKNISKTTKNKRNQYVKRIKKMIKNYSNGICFNDLKKVCNSLQIGVRIYDPMNIKSPFLEYLHDQSRKIFNYINTRENHLELKNSNKNTISAHLLRKEENMENITEMNYNKLEKIEIEDINQMLEIKKKLEENNEFYIYKRNKFCINNIRTNGTEYILKLQHMEKIEEFEEKTDMRRFIMNTNENKELNNFIFNGVKLSNAINYKKDLVYLNENGDFQQYTKYSHIDQKKSYIQFKEVGEYYNGFPTIINNFRSFENCNIKDIRTFLNTHQGYFQINNISMNKMDPNIKNHLNSLKNYLKNEDVYTSIELVYLWDNGLRFKLLNGCWCEKTFDIKDEDLDLIRNKVNIDGVNEVGLYAIYGGLCASVRNKEQYYFRTSKKFCENLSAIDNKYDIKYDNQNKTGIIYVKKEEINHKAHIGGFIFGYQRINLFRQLFKMDHSQVLRVVMDGIFYKHDYKPEIIKTYREKEGHLYNFDSNSFCNKINIAKKIEKLDLIKYEEIDDGQYIFFGGAGGNGKSYKACNNNKDINTLFIAPSYTLARAQKKDFPDINEDVLMNVLEGRQWNKFHKDYPTVILDEATMITEEMKQKIINKFPYSKLYFCGDLEKHNDNTISYQLPPINNKPMNLDGFNKINNFEKNYRFLENDKIREIIKVLRHCIKNEIDIQQTLKIFRNIMKNENRIINEEDLKEIYNIKDYILSARKKCNKCDHSCNCATNHVKKFNELLGYKGNKYLVIKNGKQYSNGDIIYENEIGKMTTGIEKRHSFTIHQIQGKTIKNEKVIIYTKDFFDITMLYVAVSRVKSLNQLYLLD